MLATPSLQESPHYREYWARANQEPPPKERIERSPDPNGFAMLRKELGIERTEEEDIEAKKRRWLEQGLIEVEDNNAGGDGEGA